MSDVYASFKLITAELAPLQARVEELSTEVFLSDKERGRLEIENQVLRRAVQSGEHEVKAEEATVAGGQPTSSPPSSPLEAVRAEEESSESGENDVLQAQVARLKETAAAHRTEKSSWLKTAARLRAENQALSSSLAAPDGLSAIELHNRRLLQELESLGGKHMQANMEARILQQQVISLQSTCTRAFVVQKRMEGESEKLQTSLMQLSASSDDAPDLNAAGDGMSLGPLSFHLVNLQQRLKRADQERDSGRKNTDALKYKANELDRKCSKLTRAHRRAETEVVTLQAVLKQVRGAADSGQHELALVKQHLAGALESQQRVEHDRTAALSTASELRHDARELEALRKALADAEAEHVMLSKRAEHSTQCKQAAEAELDRLLVETVKLKYAMGQTEEDKQEAKSAAKKNALEIEELQVAKRDLLDRLSAATRDLDTATIERDRDDEQVGSLSRNLFVARTQVKSLEQQLVQLGQTAQTLQTELTQARSGLASGSGGGFARPEQTAAEHRALSKRVAALTEEVALLEEAKFQSEDMATKVAKELQIEAHGAQELAVQVARISEALAASTKEKQKLKWGSDELQHDLAREVREAEKLRTALGHAEARGDAKRKEVGRANTLLAEADAATKRFEEQKKGNAEALRVERERRVHTERAHQDLSKQHSALLREEQALQDRLVEVTRNAQDLKREMMDKTDALVAARAAVSHRNSTLEQAHINVEQLEQQLVEQKAQVVQAESRHKLKQEGMERVQADLSMQMRLLTEEEATKAKKLRDTEAEVVKQRDAIRTLQADEEAATFERRKFKVDASEAEDRFLVLQRRLEIAEETEHDESRRSQSAGSELDGVRREVVQVHKELQVALKSLSERATQEADIVRLSKEKSELALDSDRLRAALTELEADLKTAHQLDVERLASQVGELQVAKDALQTEIDHLRHDLRAMQLQLDESRGQVVLATSQLGLRVSALDKELVTGKAVIAQQDADLHRVGSDNVDLRRTIHEMRMELDRAVSMHRQELNHHLTASQSAVQKLTALCLEHERLQESERELQRKADDGALALVSLKSQKTEHRERVETLDREHKTAWATLAAEQDNKVQGLRRQLDQRDLAYRKLELEVMASNGKSTELEARKSELANAYQKELSEVNRLMPELQAMNAEHKTTVASLQNQHELYRTQLTELRADKSKAIEVRASLESRLHAGDTDRQELQALLVEAQVEVARCRFEAKTTEQEKDDITRRLEAAQMKHTELGEERASLVEMARQQQRLSSQKELEAVRLEATVERVQGETVHILQLKSVALDRVAELEAELKEVMGTATISTLELQRAALMGERAMEQKERLEASLAEARDVAMNVRQEKEAASATFTEQVISLLILPILLTYQPY
jgi:chromosome segregation ATPase